MLLKINIGKNLDWYIKLICYYKSRYRFSRFERDCKRYHDSGASELLYYVVILFLFELAIGRKICYSTKHIKNNVFDLTKVFS